eukprot:EG_transcript_2348
MAPTALNADVPAVSLTSPMSSGCGAWDPLALGTAGPETPSKLGPPQSEASEDESLVSVYSDGHSRLLKSASVHSLEAEPAAGVAAADLLNHTWRADRLTTIPGRMVVFVAAGYEGKRFIFDIAHQMKLRVVVIDGEQSWSRSLVDEGVADAFIPLNIEELDDATFAACVEAINGAKERMGRLDGIVSFCELAQPLVARLTAHFGLPGNSFEAVMAARDKHASREAFRQAKLPTPKFYRIETIEQCTDAYEHVGFPAVIKPVCGAASIGVMRVETPAELRDGVERVHKQLLQARVVNGALQEGNGEFEGQGCDAEGWIDTAIIMEEYLDGQEVDVDVIMFEGESRYEGVSDNWPTLEPYFQETGCNCPSLLPAAHQAELQQLAIASCQALGLKFGVFHVEAKYTSRGARIVEVNCRMGGGSIYLTNRLTFGVDLVIEQLIISCGGIPLERVENRKPLCGVAESTTNCPRSGYLANADFLHPWQANPRMVYTKYCVHSGQRVFGPEEGMPMWMCEVMCVGATVEQAIQFIKEDFEAQVSFPIVDKCP